MNAPTYTPAEALPLFVDYFTRAACVNVHLTIREGVVSTQRNELCRFDDHAAAVETITEARRRARRFERRGLAARADAAWIEAEHHWLDIIFNHPGRAARLLKK